MQKPDVFFLASFARRVIWRSAFPIFILLVFFGSLSWAKWQDPFARKWFTRKSTSQEPFQCVAILPKPMRQYPVIIYAHAFGGNLMTDGNDLRQMSEMGLAAVTFDYDQTNDLAFSSEFKTLLNWLHHQRWVDTNAVVWVGSDLGADRLLKFALQHPGQQPQLLIELSASTLPASRDQPLINIHCPILLIHDGQDEIVPVSDAQNFVSLLQSNHLSIALQIIPGAGHDMGLDRKVIFRCIGEYCLTHLAGKNAWKNYHSIAQWQAEAPPFWLFCLPAAIWAAGCIFWARRHISTPREKIVLTRGEIVLRCIAAILTVLALADTAIHLIPPHFASDTKTLSIARQYLLQPKERNDFDYLATQPIWHDQKLKVLLTHVELANYNRTLVNWQLDDSVYRDYILSPTITDKPGEQFNWRRPLWEEFYPRIRHENSPTDAAAIVARHLRERVTIADISNPPREISDIWLRQITDKAGFEIIYVAALRSVGVPARLDLNGKAEIYTDYKWQPAPRPVIEQL
jgi:pimeloyl-ACP methyl ester carboxylesterase